MRNISMALILAACSGGGPTEGSKTTESTTGETTESCLSTDCTSDTEETTEDTGATSTPTGASLRVTFSIDADVAARMNEPAEGPFIGEVYRAEDVGAFGPSNDAVALGEIAIENLVLPTDGSVTDVLLTLQPVPPIEIAILGFVDTDGNNDPNDPGPDADDPVTLPGDNTFTLLPDVENTVEVHFGLLNPF